jgi:hypothetical protein
MAAKSKRQYEYVAHILRNGTTVEIAGTKEVKTVQKIYDYLKKRAAEMGGVLLTHMIKDDKNLSSVPEVVRTSEETVEPDHEPTFGADGFRLFTSDYSGASRLKFKEK